MQSSRFAELVAIVGFLIGGVIYSNARDGLLQFGALISVGSLVWYFKWGNKLSGWIGPTEEEMLGQLQQIEREIEMVAATPNGPDKYKKEAELSSKKIALERKQWEFRAATSKLAARTVPVAGLKTQVSEAKAAEVSPIKDQRYTYAIELMEATGGYMAIFRKGTEAQQAKKLNEIMDHMDELKTIDSWLEDVSKMSVEERAPFRVRAEKTMARKTEILKHIFRAF